MIKIPRTPIKNKIQLVKKMGSKAEKPYPMPIAGNDMVFPNPGMPKYTSIKKSKQILYDSSRF